MGWLDRDSNAACDYDGIDIENVIYPNGIPAPARTYTVRVDMYEQCDDVQLTKFAVQVRENDVVSLYCGTFVPTDEDSGGQSSGRTITTFVVDGG